MKCGIGTVAAKFLFWEFGFFAVQGWNIGKGGGERGGGVGRGGGGGAKNREEGGIEIVRDGELELYRNKSSTAER
jgi:hypothetical protein